MAFYKLFRMNYMVMPGIRRAITRPERICQMTAEFYGFTFNEILVPNRRPKYASAREMAWYLLRNVCKMSLPEIGIMFNRHHTTVLHGLVTITGLLDTDELLNSQMQTIKSRILGI